MNLFLWRHGKAETGSDTGKDEDRTLTPEGRNEVIEVADFVFGVKGVPKPEKIFASPFQRAKESAEMIQGFLGCEQGLEIFPALKSGTSFPQIVTELKNRVKNLRNIALIGHVPDLENFAYGFLDGQM